MSQPSTLHEPQPLAFVDLPGGDDPRPLPDAEALQQVGSAVMAELLDLVLGSPLEDRFVLICEGLIGGFHSAALRLEREADRARDALSRGLREFDGSEVADHDLQMARHAADAADVAVGCVEAIRDAAAAAYANATGECWSPWRGQVRSSGSTAAQIEAEQLLRARRARDRAETQTGPVVAFRGAPSATSPTDASRIFDALNWAHGQWPEMALALAGAPGGEQLAKRWAAQKRVPLVLARADFGRDGRAAPFRANDRLLALEPVCVLTLSTSLEAHDDQRAFGPALDLADRARRAGVSCVRIGVRVRSP
jgi:hypothetical protein